MKLNVWNILTIITLASIAGVALIYLLIFINPHAFLNPFPPPTATVYSVSPSETPTLRQMPPTWTTTPEAGNRTPGLLVSSTLRATRTPLSLLTFTPSPVLSKTITPTRTRTVTRTNTPGWTISYSDGFSVFDTSTPTASPKPTKNATKTMASKQTQTATNAPLNPTIATETNYGLTSYTIVKKNCTRSYNAPSFSWVPVTGATGYYTFWGIDSGGISTNLQTDPIYTPNPVGSGIYYLRLRTKFSWGERSDWTTLFTYCYDSDPPSNPTSVKVTDIISEQWTNIPDPTFFWVGASDVGSGILDYYVYWGINESGSCPNTPQFGTDFSAPQPISTNKYYLRIRTEDRVGNLASCKTIFQFWYDGTAPTDPGTPGENSSPTGQLNFIWTASTDTNSGIDHYELRFIDPSLNVITTETETRAWESPILTEAGEYTLEVRAVDVAGNKSGWVSGTATPTL